MRSVLSVFALLLASSSAIAASPSFNCRKASSIIEHAICSSDELSALDVQLSTVYQRLIAASSPVDKVWNRTKEINVIWSRDHKCLNSPENQFTDETREACLADIYRSAITVVEKDLVRQESPGRKLRIVEDPESYAQQTLPPLVQRPVANGPVTSPTNPDQGVSAPNVPSIAINCELPTSEAEAFICSKPELLAADRDMSDKFVELATFDANAGIADFEATRQAGWVGMRDACILHRAPSWTRPRPASECVAQEYDSRSVALETELANDKRQIEGRAEEKRIRDQAVAQAQAEEQQKIQMEAEEQARAADQVRAAEAKRIQDEKDKEAAQARAKADAIAAQKAQVVAAAAAKERAEHPIDYSSMTDEQACNAVVHTSPANVAECLSENQMPEELHLPEYLSHGDYFWINSFTNGSCVSEYRITDRRADGTEMKAIFRCVNNPKKVKGCHDGDTVCLYADSEPSAESIGGKLVYESKPYDPEVSEQLIAAAVTALRSGTDGTEDGSEESCEKPLFDYENIKGQIMNADPSGTALTYQQRVLRQTAWECAYFVVQGQCQSSMLSRDDCSTLKAMLDQVERPY